MTTTRERVVSLRTEQHLSDIEIARAVDVSRERVRQIRVSEGLTSTGGQCAGCGCETGHKRTKHRLCPQCRPKKRRLYGLNGGQCALVWLACLGCGKMFARDAVQRRNSMKRGQRLTFHSRSCLGSWRGRQNRGRKHPPKVPRVVP